MNTCLHFSRIYAWVKLLDDCKPLCLTFQKTCFIVLQSVIPLSALPSVNKGSDFFTSSRTLTKHPLDFCHLNKCAVMPYWEKMLGIFSWAIRYMYIILKNWLLKSYTLFSLDFVLIVEFKSSLYIYWI